MIGSIYNAMSEQILREVIRNVLEEAALPAGWQSWSHEALKVPFDGSKGKGEGVGRGEERLAIQLGGQVMGGGVSFDVVDSENRKWEVKEPESKSGGGRVRIEQEGIRVTAPVLRKLASILTKIIRFFDKKTLKKVPGISEVFSTEDVQSVYLFLEQHADGIFRGEIGLSRIKAYHEMLSMIADRLAKAPQNSSAHQLVHSKSGTSLEVDDPTMVQVAIQVAKKLNMPLDKMLSSVGITPVSFTRAQLSGEAFSNPGAFMESTWGSIKSSKMFGDVDGVVLVMDSGYRVIPREELDTALAFHSITKGKPKLVIRPAAG